MPDARAPRRNAAQPAAPAGVAPDPRGSPENRAPDRRAASPVPSGQPAAPEPAIMAAPPRPASDRAPDAKPAPAPGGISASAPSAGPINPDLAAQRHAAPDPCDGPPRAPTRCHRGRGDPRDPAPGRAGHPNARPRPPPRPLIANPRGSRAPRTPRRASKSIYRPDRGRGGEARPGARPGARPSIARPSGPGLGPRSSPCLISAPARPGLTHDLGWKR